MPPAGLEPATLWLEATRAIRLRHEGCENCYQLLKHSALTTCILSNIC